IFSPSTHTAMEPGACGLSGSGTRWASPSWCCSLAFCGLYLARLDVAEQPVPIRHPALDQDPAPIEETAPAPTASAPQTQDPAPDASADAPAADSPGEGYDWAPQRASRRATRETEGA
ncbi:hypothetical protein I2V20_08425, partial [Rothia kristinae]|nr:hypothetical protein [Rothia kristinae]